ncbi:MAG TPA: M48 family metalloprotease [Candidatus Tumulicola sp.]|nr:M48 family metalloprotease [Candidatus Tumulicola sp.]
MSWRRALAGACAGAAAGYVAVRVIEAAGDWLAPAGRLTPDARTYARRHRLNDLAETVRGVLGAIALAGPIGVALDRSTERAPVWLRPALFAIPACAATAAAELPVAFVTDYTLERRYGLSDRSREAWLTDFAKGAAVSSATTVVLATLFGWAVRRTPHSWPLLAAAGTLPLLALGNLIVPLLVMPLFNAFQPVSGPLETRLRELASRLGVADAEIMRMDLSRQTRKANAFVTGIAGTHRIVLGDTLIEAFREDEIEFVVAHEIGHYARKDTWRLMVAAELLACALYVAAHSLVPAAQRDALRDRPILLARYYAAMAAASLAARPLLLAYARSREWAADRFAIAATGAPRAGASALRRLRDRNLADEDPPRWYELLFGSHPSLRTRIAALDGQSS